MTLRLFNSKKAEIEAKTREIERKQQLIESAIASLQAQRNGNQISWTVQTTGVWPKGKNPIYCRQESLCKAATRKSYFRKSPNMKSHSRKNLKEVSNLLPNLYKVGKDAFLKGDYESDFSLCSEISKSTADLDECEKRPAGLRFQSMHRFSFDKTNEPAFQKDNPLFYLLSDTEKLLRENELETCGDLLIKEIATHLNSESHEVQIMLDIPVTHKNR